MAKHTKRTAKPLSASVRKNLQERAKRSTLYNFSDLRKVFRRGQGAWLTGSRPGIGQQQWAYARVRSFLQGGSHDQDIRRAARKRRK